MGIWQLGFVVNAATTLLILGTAATLQVQYYALTTQFAASALLPQLLVQPSIAGYLLSLLLIELLTGVYLGIKAHRSAWLTRANLALLAAIWLSFLPSWRIAVRLESSGPVADFASFAMLLHWLRLALWTARATLCCCMIGCLLRQSIVAEGDENTANRSGP